MRELKAEIRTLAASLGFPLMGITVPEAIDADYARMNDWLAGGHHADMHYLERRKDVTAGSFSAAFPEFERLIVFGLPYGMEPLTDNSPEPGGRISRYATGRDYHRIFEKAFKKLTRMLVEAGDRPRAFVDYGPVMERAAARAAGLGFIGKSSALIVPGYGSYVFLGVIASRLALPADAPHSGEDCGDCARCLAACPSGALATPYRVDARRCISYNSIENKGLIPEELRARMGTRILGCDACQSVCPFNRSRAAVAHPDLSCVRIPLRSPLADWLSIDADTFRARYAGTAAMRPGRTSMCRNAAIAAANSGAKELLPLIVALIEREDDPELIAQLIWARDILDR